MLLSFKSLLETDISSMLCVIQLIQAEAANAKQAALLHTTLQDYEALQSVVDEVSLHIFLVNCAPITYVIQW
jgi:hypothetical protein